MSVDDLSRVRRNAVYLFLGVVVANLATFLFRVIIAREFGPDGFGVFSLALMTTSIATMIALLGFPDGMTTFVSKFRGQSDYNKIAGVVVSSMVLSIVAAIVFSVGISLLAPLLATKVFNAPGLAGVLWWFAWIIPANVAIDLSAAYFLGMERGGINTLIKKVIPKVSLLIFLLLIAILDGPIVAVGIAYLAATGIGALVGLTAVGLSFPFSRTDGISIELREYLTYSFPLLTSTAIGFFLNWTDTMVVGIFLGSIEVGIYQSAFALAANIHIVMGAISGSLYPNFSTLFNENDINSIRNKFTEGTRWIVITSAAPVVYLIGFSGLSLEMLFGDAFRSGSETLMILVAGQGLMLLFGPSSNLLKAALEPRYVAITYGLAAILNLVLNFTLIPQFGIIGAALATSVTHLLADYLHFYRAQYHVDIQLPIDPLIRALSAGLIAYFPSLYLEKYVNSLVLFGLHIAVFSVLYIITLIAVGGIRKEKIRSVLPSNQ